MPTPTRMSRRSALITGSACLAVPMILPTRLHAQTVHDVEMLNVDPDNPRARNVFLPRILVAQPGDSIRFVATDRGHNSASTDGMLPEGAERWNGRINEEIEITVPVPGFYGYQCTPHLALGMVGLIVVEGDGMMDNLEAAQEVRQRGRAQQAWDEIWAEAGEMGLLAAS